MASPNGEGDDDDQVLTPARCENGRFVNPWQTWRQPSVMQYIFKVFLKENRANSAVGNEDELNKNLPILKPDFSSWSASDPGVRCMWVGHATVLAQFDGITLITDPQFSERCSPVQWLMGAKRYRAPPCTERELPPVDVVLISHDHYDHLDLDSCRNLYQAFGRRIHWFVPLGLKEWMVSNLGLEVNSQRVVEMEWWQENRVKINGKHITVAFTPAQHWCKRSLFDDNKVLWGSWCVFGDKHRFFFAGDTGYCEAFKQIGRKYRGFDLAAIPIGAYSPRWYMSPQHVDPLEAVQIHQDIHSKHSLAIHWGTFKMTYEPYLEPREKLREAIEELEVEEESFITLKHGETKAFQDPSDEE